MHLLIGERAYNYNPSGSTGVYFQITYTRGGNTYTLRYTFPNSAVSVQGVLDWMVNDEVDDYKSFVGTADPKGKYVTIGIDYTNYEKIRFYDDEDAITAITLTIGTGYSQQSRYLFSHFGFTSRLDNNTGISISTKVDGTYMQTPYTGTFRLPLNVDTGISRGGANIFSQVSSEYELVTTRTEGGTDITPSNLYNSYTYLTRGKRINIVNYPYSKLYSLNNFLEYISEDDCVVSTNGALSQILFSTTNYFDTIVKVDASESGSTTVKELQENLVSFDIVLYHNSTFRGV